MRAKHVTLPDKTKTAWLVNLGPHDDIWEKENDQKRKLTLFIKTFIARISLRDETNTFYLVAVNSMYVYHKSNVILFYFIH